MNTAITLSYLLIFGGIVIWRLLLPSGKKVPRAIVDGILSAYFIPGCPEIYP